MPIGAAPKKNASPSSTGGWRVGFKKGRALWEYPYVINSKLFISNTGFLWFIHSASSGTADRLSCLYHSSAER